MTVFKNQLKTIVFIVNPFGPLATVARWFSTQEGPGVGRWSYPLASGQW